MARRSDSSPQELQQRVLDTVENLLSTLPARQLSLRQVARDAGYTPGALVHSFGSWGLLLLRVNAQTLDSLYGHLKQAVASIDDPQAGILRLAEAYLEFASQHQNRWQLIFEHKLGSDEPLPQWHHERIQRLFAELERRLAQLNPDACIREIETAARVVWGGVHGITLLSVDEKLFTQSPIAGVELIRSLLSQYLKGWIASTEKPTSDKAF